MAAPKMIFSPKRIQVGAITVSNDITCTNAVATNFTTTNISCTTSGEFSGTLAVGGVTTQKGALNCSSTVAVAGALGVKGAITGTTLELSSTANIAGALCVKGAITGTTLELSSTAIIAGNTTIKGTFSCTGAAQFSSTLVADGLATFNANIIAGGTIPATHTAAGANGQFVVATNSVRFYFSNSWFTIAGSNTTAFN